MRADESRADAALKARLDAMTKGHLYQWAEVWLERNPGATAKELLLFLAEQAGEARSNAIQAEMLSENIDELDAARMVDRYMNYRDAIIRELDGA